LTRCTNQSKDTLILSHISSNSHQILPVDSI